jgi:beta-galactosidase/beta-glucuronidase
MPGRQHEAVMGAFVVVAAFLVLAGLASAGAVLESKRPALSTPWTAKVSKRAPLPEYPRPQLARKRWLNLNGQWQFAAARPGQRPPFGRRLRETILVPFPMQSAISGIKRYERRSWYRRLFRVPRGWRGKHVELNFGAVTHKATVFVNGRRIGAHEGSYDSFAFDITRWLSRGQNELIVGVYDDVIEGGQPTGKQFPTSVSAFFTASSGIWQTVWIEPVERTHVARLDMTPDLRRGRVLVTVHATRPRGATVLLRAREGRYAVARAKGRPGRQIVLRVRKPKLWSPERPFLYDLDIALRRGPRVLDRVESYFGMRSIAVRRRGGVPRLVLNGRFVFQIGTLDQGYWPDGIYTAPTDKALAFDLKAEKGMGFNLVRKHVKVEPQRWYYHADRLGLLVWQDMPNMPVAKPVTEAAERQFERELRQMIDEHGSSPSIISWIPFNEGWGQFDVDRITNLTKRLDPSRLVNGNSGAANCCATIEPRAGDVRDTHTYPGPFAVEPDHRATVTGEFGRLFARSAGHEWNARRQYPFSPTKQANEGLLRSLWAALRQQMRTPGLSAAVFTEITDVEEELAGLLTFDRRVHKVSPRLVRRLNRNLIRASLRSKLRPARGGP